MRWLAMLWGLLCRRRRPASPEAELQQLLAASRPQSSSALDPRPSYPDLLAGALRSRLAYLEPGAVRAKCGGAAAAATAAAEVDRMLCGEMEGVAAGSVLFYDSGIDADAQAFMWDKGGTTYLTFRGSSSVKDAMADLDVRHCREDGAPSATAVHTGVHRQLDSVWPAIVRDLGVGPGAPPRTVCVSGHSLGGALAMLAAARLGRQAGISVSCMTFGAPRVGNTAFVDWLDGGRVRGWRVFNEKDPVPMLPPVSDCFSHVGASGVEATLPGLCLDGGCGATVERRDRTWYQSLGDIDLAAPAAEHDLGVYIQRMAALGALHAPPGPGVLWD